MLKIRLQRIGRKKKPVYRIVINEHTASIKAAYIDLLGRYNRTMTPPVFEVDEKKLEDWIRKGAKPTNTVARLLKGQGRKDMDQYIEEMPDKKRKEKGEGAKEAPAKAVAEAKPQGKGNS